MTVPSSLSNLNLTTFNKIYPLLIQKYNTLVPDPNANILDKINSIIDSLNSVGNLSNDVVDNWNKVMAWVMNDGLTTDVSNKLDAMVTAGTFDTIFQKDIAPSLGNLSDLTTVDKSNLVHALNEVDGIAKTNQTNLGTLSNLQTANKEDLVSAVNDNVASLASIATTTGISVESYDRLSVENDDTGRVQRAINDAGTKAVNGLRVAVIFPNLYTVSQDITLTSPNVCLIGPGGIKNGKLVIGNNTSQQVLEFFVFNMTFYYDSIQSGKNGIELQYAEGGHISFCTFVNTDKAIYVRPIDSFQHTRRITVEYNRFKMTNYAMYIDQPANATNTFTAGDLHFIGNQDANAAICHFYAIGIDGLILTQNTCFSPTYTQKDPNKTYNIYIDRGNWINIFGNNLFEAGLDSIYLSHVQNPNVGPNNIAWPGQREPGCGVRIKNGDNSGGQYNLGVIHDNNIMFPTLHGVSIEDNSGNMIVSDNNTRSAGYTNYYYGTTDLSTIAHYGVMTDTNTSTMNVHNNFNPANANNFLGSGHFYDNNVEANNVIQRSNEQKGTTANANFTTSWNSNILTVPFSTPFPSGTTPIVILTTVVQSVSGDVNPVVSVTNTGFTISGQSSVALTAQFNYIAKI